MHCTLLWTLIVALQRPLDTSHTWTTNRPAPAFPLTSTHAPHLAMDLECGAAAPAGHLPHPDRSIPPSSGRLRPIRAETDTPDRVGVALHTQDIDIGCEWRGVPFTASGVVRMFDEGQLLSTFSALVDNSSGDSNAGRCGESPCTGLTGPHSVSPALNPP